MHARIDAPRKRKKKKKKKGSSLDVLRFHQHCISFSSSSFKHLAKSTLDFSLSLMYVHPLFPDAVIHLRVYVALPSTMGEVA